MLDGMRNARGEARRKNRRRTTVPPSALSTMKQDGATPGAASGAPASNARLGESSEPAKGPRAVGGSRSALHRFLVATESRLTPGSALHPSQSSCDDVEPEQSRPDSANGSRGVFGTMHESCWRHLERLPRFAPEGRARTSVQLLVACAVLYSAAAVPFRVAFLRSLESSNAALDALDPSHVH